MALDLRELSNNESTASCNIRFSLRKITSGALISIKRFNRLLRMITRRYKSLRSDVAKRPPSSGTNGRRSGGITGITFIIIHSGLLMFFDARKASTTLSCFNASFLRCCDVSVLARWRNWLASLSKFMRSNKSRSASAPIFAINLLGSESSSNWLSLGSVSSKSRYSSSVSKSFSATLSSKTPGWITTYRS